jgi:hypothetical protein
MSRSVTYGQLGVMLDPNPWPVPSDLNILDGSMKRVAIDICLPNA